MCSMPRRAGSCDLGMFLMVLPAFGLPARPDWAVLTMAVTNLGILVPSTPGYVGPFHYFCIMTLGLLGVGELTATSYAITVHAVFYVPITLWGIGLMLRYGIEITSTSKLAHAGRRSAPATDIQGVPMVVRMRSGVGAEEALEKLVSADADEAVRQVAFVDARGRAAAHTGARCIQAAETRRSCCWLAPSYVATPMTI